MTFSAANWRTRMRTSIVLARQALQTWGPRQVLIAVGTAVALAVVIGVATVLIPNSMFRRDIPPVWWNYPVWLVTSALSGVLVATYVQPTRSGNSDGSTADVGVGAATASGDVEAGARRTSRMGMAGGVLAWFAVGCPVCNKLALLALGYSGALTWFAPMQPFLALAALVLTAVAVIWRLKGQVACSVRPTPLAVAR